MSAAVCSNPLACSVAGRHQTVYIVTQHLLGFSTFLVNHSYQLQQLAVFQSGKVAAICWKGTASQLFVNPLTPSNQLNVLHSSLSMYPRVHGDGLWLNLVENMYTTSPTLSKKCSNMVVKGLGEGGGGCQTNIPVCLCIHIMEAAILD